MLDSGALSHQSLNAASRVARHRDHHCGGNAPQVEGTAAARSVPQHLPRHSPPSTRTGLRISLRSTASTSLSLHPQLPIKDAQTSLVQQCVNDLRRTILLARAYSMQGDRANKDGPMLRCGAEEAAERVLVAVWQRLVEWEVTADEHDSAPTSRTGDRGQSVHDQILSWMSEEQHRRRIAPGSSNVANNLSFEAAPGEADERGPGGPEALWRSGQTRYTPILNDLVYLSQHLLAPLDVLRQQHLWLFISEDVPYSLNDSLYYYRVVRRAAPPLTDVQQLWKELWTTLGAAWRQRVRLLGVCRYLSGPNAFPPLPLSCGVEMPIPPAADASPLSLEHYLRLPRRQPSTLFHQEASGASQTPPSLPDEEDTCAFGPMTSEGVGITSTGQYAIREPLAARLRSLRCQLPPEGQPPAVAYTLPARHPRSLGSSQTLPSRSRPDGPGGAEWPSASVTPPTAAEATSCPWFDVSREDLTKAAAVPYLSPEVYVALRRIQDGGAGVPPPTMAHGFSDDAWNMAVLTVEYGLADFGVNDPHRCHIGTAGPPLEGVKTDPRIASSVYKDVVQCLNLVHHIPLEATYNYLYASLSALGDAIISYTLNSSEGTWMKAAAEGRARDPRLSLAGSDSARPSPMRMAQEWLQHLVASYGADAVRDLWYGVATTGLRWTRRARWEAFVTAHSSPSKDAGSATGPPPGTLSSVSAPGGGTVATCLVGPAEASRQQCEDLLQRLQTPLLPLFPESTTATADGANPNHHLLWERLQAWQRRMDGLCNGGGGPGRMNERLAARFTALVRLARQGIEKQCSGVCGDDEGEDGTTSPAPGGAHSHIVVSHPFMRGLVERSQLPVFMAAQPVETASVFLRYETVMALLAPPPPFAAPDEGGPTPSSPHSPSSLLGVRGLLQAAAGDVKWLTTTPPATGRELWRRGGGPKGTGSTLTPVTPKTEIRSALQQLLASYEFSVGQQLAMLQPLRRLLVTPGTPAELATAVRRHLIQAHQAVGTAAVPVPATLRGEVWGALLAVARCREREARYGVLRTLLLTPSDRQLSVDIPRCHQYLPLLASVEGHAKMQRLIRAWQLMNPGLAYWQGLDSMGAILLSVSFTDEPLVAAQLDAMVRQFAATEEPQKRSTCSSVEESPPSVAITDQLHQLELLLQYCDPLLASHLQQMDCPPQLFAMSWLLAVFAHRLPAAKVYLLWDLLLVYAEPYPHILLCMCCAMLLQRRTSLLGEDTSGCLAALGSGAAATDIPAVLRDAVCLAQAVPVSVGRQPYAEDQVLWSGAVRAATTAFITVSTLLEALRASTSTADGCEVAVRPTWADSGIFLVDVREPEADTTLPRGTRGQHVLGALRIPLSQVDYAAPSADSSSMGDEALQAEFHSRRSRGLQLATAELLQQRANLAMAALAPRRTTASVVLGGAVHQPLPTAAEASPLALKTAQSPHTVILPWDATRAALYPAQALAAELVTCGVHNVSILLGGVERLADAAPWVMVKKAVIDPDEEADPSG